jgi:hypothetical protein
VIYEVEIRVAGFAVTELVEPDPVLLAGERLTSREDPLKDAMDLAAIELRPKLQ